MATSDFRLLALAGAAAKRDMFDPAEADSGMSEPSAAAAAASRPSAEADSGMSEPSAAAAASEALVQSGPRGHKRMNWNHYLCAVKGCTSPARYDDVCEAHLGASISDLLRKVAENGRDVVYQILHKVVSNSSRDPISPFCSVPNLNLNFTFMSCASHVRVLLSCRH